MEKAVVLLLKFSSDNMAARATGLLLSGKGTQQQSSDFKSDLLLVLCILAGICMSIAFYCFIRNVLIKHLRPSSVSAFRKSNNFKKWFLQVCATNQESNSNDK